MKKVITTMLPILILLVFAGCSSQLAIAKDKLMLIFNENENENAVTTDFSLPRDMESVKISWLSKNEEVITIVEDVAKVLRPIHKDEKVKLIATLSYKNKTTTKEFLITVLKENSPYLKALIAYYEDSITKNDYLIENNIELISTINVDDVKMSIVWMSSEPALLSKNGVVNRPAYYAIPQDQLGKEVELLATLSNDEKHMFKVIIKKQDIIDNEKQYLNNSYNKHGKLSVQGANLVNQYGENVQLVGLSTHGINYFPQYVSYNTFSNAKKTFGINTIRLSMYTAGTAAYCTQNGRYQEHLKSLIKMGIDYLTNLDMYAIVDWHQVGASEALDKNPLTYVQEAKEFFDEISKAYKNQHNIIYEICNEPNGSTTWDDVKKYANEVIPVIRANNKEAIIIVGNPNWSSDLYSVMKSPLLFDNVMYAFHFYAATHKDAKRKMVSDASDSHLPIFVSEYALMDASGKGELDLVSGQAWYKLLNERNISYVAWNISNGAGDSCIFKTNAIDDFSDTNLKPWGIWLKEYYQEILNVNGESDEI